MEDVTKGICQKGDCGEEIPDPAEYWCPECCKRYCAFCCEVTHKRKFKDHKPVRNTDPADPVRSESGFNWRALEADKFVTKISEEDVAVARLLCTAAACVEPCSALPFTTVAHLATSMRAMSPVHQAVFMLEDAAGLREKVDVLFGRSSDDVKYVLVIRFDGILPMDHSAQLHRFMQRLSSFCTEILSAEPKRWLLVTGVGGGGQIAICLSLLLYGGLAAMNRLKCIVFGSPPLPHMTEEERTKLNPAEVKPWIREVLEPRDRYPEGVEFYYRLVEKTDRTVCRAFALLLRQQTEGLHLDERMHGLRGAAGTEPTRFHVGEVRDHLGGWSTDGDAQARGYLYSDQEVPHDGKRAVLSKEWDLTDVVSHKATVCGSSSWVEWEMEGDRARSSLLGCFRGEEELSLQSFPCITLESKVKIGDSIDLVGLFNSVQLHINREPVVRPVSQDRLSTLDAKELYMRAEHILLAISQMEERNGAYEAFKETLSGALHDMRANTRLFKDVGTPVESVDLASRFWVSYSVYACRHLPHSVRDFVTAMMLSLHPWRLFDDVRSGDRVMGTVMPTYLDALEQTRKFWNVPSWVPGVMERIPYYEEQLKVIRRNLDDEIMLRKLLLIPTCTMRDAQRKIIFVGVMGRKGQGKSTLVSRVFGVKVTEEDSSLCATLTARTYISTKMPNCVVADMPGSDDPVKTAIQSMKKMFRLPDVLLLVVNGTHKVAAGDVKLLSDATAERVKVRVVFTNVDRYNPRELEDIPGEHEKLLQHFRVASGMNPSMMDAVTKENSWMVCCPPPDKVFDEAQFVAAHPGVSPRRRIIEWLQSIQHPLNEEYVKFALNPSWCPSKTNGSEWFLERLMEENHQGRAPAQVTLREHSSPSPVLSLSTKWCQRPNKSGVGQLMEECDVQAFADGHDYFLDLAGYLRRAKQMVLICGWDFNPHLVLDRSKIDVREVNQGDERSFRCPTIGQTLCTLAERGVDVRVLLWKPPATAITITSHQVEEYFADSKVQVVMEKAGLPNSHHQKVVVVDNGRDELVSYLGGIDLAVGRFDTPDHPIAPVHDPAFLQDWYCPEAGRDASEKAVPQPRQPWHDVHCRIRGSAALEVYRVFAERWCSAVSSRKAFSALELPYPKGLTFESERADERFQWHAQILESSGRNPKRPVDGVKQTYEDVISKASRFIYIENQYFISSSTKWACDAKTKEKAPNGIATAIVNRIIEMIGHDPDPQAPLFHVFIVCPLYPETDWASKVMRWVGLQILSHQFETFRWMYRAIETHLRTLRDRKGLRATDFLSVSSLAQVDPSSRGTLPGRNMIYVHSKLMIVDDEYMIIGSANVNERSMGGADSEICVGAYQIHRAADELELVSCTGAVHTFRQQLFCEHLGAHFDETVPLGARSFTLDFIRDFQTIGRENWERYVATPPRPLSCSLIEFPIHFHEEKNDLFGKLVPTATVIGNRTMLVCSSGEKWGDSCETRYANTLSHLDTYWGFTF